MMSTQNKNEPLSAESLYRHFKRHRPNTPADPASTQTPLLSTVPSGVVQEYSAAGLYKNFKSTRRENKSDAVDDIMDAIREAVSPIAETSSPGDTITLAEQPLPGSDVTVPVRSVKARRTIVPTQSQVLVPAIAAVLVCLFIIPLWLMSGNQHSTDLPAVLADAIPVELSGQATEVVAYVRSENSYAYGFSASSMAEQSAFQAGILATDLWLLAQSNNTDLLQDYVSRSDISQWSEITPAYNRYVESINEESAEEQRAQLNALLAATVQYVDDSGQSDWFAIGKSIQSIYLAGEYALSTSDQSPLERSFALSAGLSVPSGDAPAGRSVATLINGVYTMPMAPAEIRQIIKITENIKLLMH